jgi:hypothetical protein
MEQPEPLSTGIPSVYHEIRCYFLLTPTILLLAHSRASTSSSMSAQQVITAENNITGALLLALLSRSSSLAPRVSFYSIYEYVAMRLRLHYSCLRPWLGRNKKHTHTLLVSVFGRGDLHEYVVGLAGLSVDWGWMHRWRMDDTWNWRCFITHGCACTDHYNSSSTSTCKLDGLISVDWN